MKPLRRKAVLVFVGKHSDSNVRFRPLLHFSAVFSTWREAREYAKGWKHYTIRQIAGKQLAMLRIMDLLGNLDTPRNIHVRNNWAPHVRRIQTILRPWDERR